MIGHTALWNRMTYTEAWGLLQIDRSKLENGEKACHIRCLGLNVICQHSIFREKVLPFPIQVVSQVEK